MFSTSYAADLTLTTRPLQSKTNPPRRIDIPAKNLVFLSVSKAITAFSAMRTHRKAPCREAFTLIELLIVISIISLLASLGLAGARIATEKARQVAIKADLSDLVTGINAYHSDRGRMPIPDAGSDITLPLDEGAVVLQVLLGENLHGLNPTGTVYISPKPGTNGAGGLVGETGRYGYLDPWGEPYQVILDGNHDQRIANPDRSNDDPRLSGTPGELFIRAAAFSSGKDRQPHTRDDIVSWR